MKQKNEWTNKIESILKRNGLFERYNDTEDGSFSEGEKILSLFSQHEAEVREELREQMIQEIEIMGDVTDNHLFVDGRDWKEYKKALLDDKKGE